MYGNLITVCECSNPMRQPIQGRNDSHNFTAQLSECVMMFKEHFGDDAEEPNGGDFRLMMWEVVKKHGWHHIIEDVNKLRTEKPEYVGGSVATWGGFCTSN